MKLNWREVVEDVLATQLHDKLFPPHNHLGRNTKGKVILELGFVVQFRNAFYKITISFFPLQMTGMMESFQVVSSHFFCYKYYKVINNNLYNVNKEKRRTY